MAPTTPTPEGGASVGSLLGALVLFLSFLAPLPLKYVLNSANTILAQGAAMANMTLVDRFLDGDITKLIKTGQMITVNPQAGNIQIVSS